MEGLSTIEMIIGGVIWLHVLDTVAKLIIMLVDVFVLKGA
jgi:hypothetical protein